MAQMVRRVGIEWEDLGSIPGPNIFLFSNFISTDHVHNTPWSLPCASLIQPIDYHHHHQSNAPSKMAHDAPSSVHYIGSSAGVGLSH